MEIVVDNTDKKTSYSIVREMTNLIKVARQVIKINLSNLLEWAEPQLLTNLLIRIFIIWIHKRPKSSKIKQPHPNIS